MPEILQYQTQRALDEVSGYPTGLQLRTEAGQRVYIALSDTELVFFFDGGPVLHYDLEGRLAKLSEPGRYLRRSLSNRVLCTRKLTRQEGGGIHRVVLGPDAADALVREAHERVAPLCRNLQTSAAAIEFAKPSVDKALAPLLALLQRLACFDAEAARKDGERFRALYGRVAVLPPDQYNALVLQATQGCSYGHCVFCDLYRGVRYQRRSPAEFRQHIRDVVAFHGKALRTRRSIFLGEANALTLPQPELIELLQVLHEHFELPPINGKHRNLPARWWLGNETRFDGISSFLDAFTRPHRSADDYRQLRELGLRRVYIGMETGDDALLGWLEKPGTALDIRHRVEVLKQAGLAVGVIVLLGAGGESFYDSHVRHSAELLNDLPLGGGDYIYFSPLVIQPGGVYETHASAWGATALTEARMRQQEREIRDALRFDRRRGRPYIARYELETFVY